MTAAELSPPGEDRAVGRVVELASGLLMLLDEHGITARLPLDARAQTSRLRHAVKLAVQATAAAPSSRNSRSPAPTLWDPAGALQAWIASQPWAAVDSGPVGWVYLLCLRDPTTGQHRPLKGNGARGQFAGHYWGWTIDLVRRITQEHRNPNWTGPGRLIQVALSAGLTFELAWLEYPATRGRERRLKSQGSAYRRCPLCRGTGGPLDPAAAAAAVLRAGGAR